MKRKKDSSETFGCGIVFIAAFSIAWTLSFAAKIRNRYLLLSLVMIPVVFYYLGHKLLRKAKATKRERDIPLDVFGLEKNLDDKQHSIPVMNEREIKRVIKHPENDDPGIVMRLLYSMRDPEDGVRELAFQALLKIKSPHAVDAILQVLDHKNPQLMDVCIELLGEIKDTKALPRLINITDSPTFLHSTTCYPHLESTLQKIRSSMLKKDNHLLCGICFLRYKEYRLKCKSYENFHFFACRKCGSDAFRIPGAHKIILAMDNNLKETGTIKGDTVYVDWRKFKQPFDLDELHIKDASETELEELVMLLNNDMDGKRRRGMKKKKLFLAEDIQLSLAKQNLLKDNFDLQLIS